MSDKEMVIFTRTYALVQWVLPQTEKFPKHYRHTVTHRLNTAVLNFQEALLMAQTSRAKIRNRHLRQADGYLLQVRLYLRLVHDWGWLSAGQYAHVSRMVVEVGQLLGGWANKNEGGYGGDGSES